MNVEAFLRGLVESILKEHPTPEDGSMAPSDTSIVAARNQLLGAIRALTHTGDLKASQVDAILDEYSALLQETTGSGKAEKVRLSGWASTSARQAGDDGLQYRRQGQDIRQYDVERSIPINRSILELDRYSIRAMSIEFLPQIIALRYSLQGDVRAYLQHDRFTSHWQWELQDDRGKSYGVLGESGGTGGTRNFVGQVNFEGPIDLEARQLDIRLRIGNQVNSILIDLEGQ